MHPPHHHLNLKLVRMTSITITPTPAERGGREDKLEEGPMLRVVDIPLVGHAYLYHLQDCVANDEDVVRVG